MDSCKQVSFSWRCWICYASAFDGASTSRTAGFINAAVIESQLGAADSNLPHVARGLFYGQF